MAKLDGWVKTCDAPDIWEKGRYCVGPESLDYLHDHNAVQRVFDGLTIEGVRIYHAKLWDTTGAGSLADLFTATCPQKVEAILKATGRWEK